MTLAGAVRYKNWKLIEWYENSLSGEEATAFELYNMETDEGETNNLVANYPQKNYSWLIN